MTSSRAISSVSPPLPTMGGDMEGRLVIGSGSGLDQLDPFPALMHDGVPPHVMFPMHPHRGVEIISYCLSGALYHEDSNGNKGTLIAGGVERNLFGRGYYHSEQPVGGEFYRGFQLFIALKPEERDLEPSWQVLEPHQVPEATLDGASVRVIAGQFRATRSPLTLRNPTFYVDVSLSPGSALDLPVPPEFAGLAYVISGSGAFGTPTVQAGANQRLVLGTGQDLRVTAAESLRFVLIAGRPIYGPTGA
ncbi:MAG TPA: pirin family protein [Chloroflexota bacterium]|nr:pirin family protein [Chloroflexota bacterium]